MGKIMKGGYYNIGESIAYGLFFCCIFICLLSAGVTKSVTDITKEGKGSDRESLEAEKARIEAELSKLK